MYYYSMKKPVLLLMLLASVLSIAACNKDKNKPEEPKPDLFEPDFSISGRLNVHQPVSFNSNYKNDTRLTWYFGNFEEKTIIGKGIRYTFTQPGTYKITMAVTDTIGGGVVSKDVVITNGADRIAGTYKWNFILRRDKYGAPQGQIPASSFSYTIPITVIGDTAMSIPDMPQMPYRGPYIVTKSVINDSEMIFRNYNASAEVSLKFETGLAGIRLVQSRNDTAFYLNGYATIFN